MQGQRGIVGWIVALVAIVAVGVVIVMATLCTAAHEDAQVEREDSTKLEESSGQSPRDGDARQPREGEKTAKDAADADADAGKSLSSYTVCIDAGHGAHADSTGSPNNPDSSVSQSIPVEPGGTSGSAAGPEYKICLAVAKMLQADLEERGVKVVQVRTSNDVTISPKDRALVANGCKADAFIRLHCDSAGASNDGFYTLVPAKTGYQAEGGLYKKSQKMGKRMHAFIVDALGATDRGVTVRSDQGGFNWCKVPAVLFEMANLDNAADDKRMATKAYKEKMAQAISDATVDYLESLG